VTGAIVLVSHGDGPRPADGWSGNPDLSADGRYVVFDSRATNLAGSDPNGPGSDVYLFDAVDGSIRRISSGGQGARTVIGDSTTPAISGDGRRIVFTSTAPLDDPVPAPARGGRPLTRLIFLYDAPTSAIRRVSRARDAAVPNGPSYFPAISADGRRVAFASSATNLAIDGRAPRRESVYLFDVDTGRLRLASRGADGPPDGYSRHPALSGDGRYVAFSSNASNLACAAGCAATAAADLNLVSDVYRVDTMTGLATRVSGGAAIEPWWHASAGAAIDGSGRVVAFSSRQPTDEADLDHDDDLYVEVLPATPGDTAAMPCGVPEPAAPPPE
jgi:Tol biopolymer transport system component